MCRHGGPTWRKLTEVCWSLSREENHALIAGNIVIIAPTAAEDGGTRKDGGKGRRATAQEGNGASASWKDATITIGEGVPRGAAQKAAGSLLRWRFFVAIRSKAEPAVSSSFVEAEYMSIAVPLAEMGRVATFSPEKGIPRKQIIALWDDSLGAINQVALRAITLLCK